MSAARNPEGVRDGDGFHLKAELQTSGDDRTSAVRSPAFRRFCAAAFALSVAFASLVSFTACSRSDATTSAANDRPRVVRIGWSPSEEEPDRRVRFDGLRAYLSERLNLPVELIETGTYSTQIEAFRAHKIEVGSISPFSYVIASSKVAIEPLVVRGYTDGRQGRYNSVLIVPADSPIHSIDDLKASAPRLTLAFVDPASTSGHLVPRAFLESIGLDAGKDFKQVIFTMSHLATAMTIKSSKVDVAASMNTGLQRLIEKGRIKPEDFRVIWKSDPIINDVTATRSDLSPAFRDELRRAYLDFPKERPELWAEFAKLFPEPGGLWVTAQDSDFDGLRRIARSLKNLNLLD